MTDLLIFRCAQLLALFQYWAHTRLGINIRGFGWLLHQLRNPRTLRVQGAKFAFRPTVASGFGRMVAGMWNEPETHLLLARLLAKTEGPLTFIDVGANVGEFVIDMARYPVIDRVYAFEPIPECAAAIRGSCELNGYSHVEVRQLALSDSRKRTTFESRLKNSGSSSIVRFGAAGDEQGARRSPSTRTSVALETSTLDDELNTEIKTNVIMLLDVEGEEVNVLRGGSVLIERTLPLIVFEYNHVSRRHFSLDDIRQVIKDRYEIFRLRPDGYLDRCFESTWNCVALPKVGKFEAAALELVRS